MPVHHRGRQGQDRSRGIAGRHLLRVLAEDGRAQEKTGPQAGRSV